MAEVGEMNNANSQPSQEYPIRALAALEAEIARMNAAASQPLTDQQDWRHRQGVITGLHKAHSIISVLPAKAGLPAETLGKDLEPSPEAGSGREDAHRLAVGTKVLEMAAKKWGPFPPDYPKIEQDFDALGMDWLDKIEFVMALEDEFNIEIPDDSVVAGWKTLQDAARLVATMTEPAPQTAQAVPEASEGTPPPESPAPRLREWTLLVETCNNFVATGWFGDAPVPAHAGCKMVRVREIAPSLPSAPSVPMGGGVDLDAMEEWYRHCLKSSPTSQSAHWALMLIAEVRSLLAKLEGR